MDRRRLTWVLAAALLGILPDARPATATPLGSGSFIVDAQPTGPSTVALCIAATFDGTSYDVFGTPVDLQAETGGVVCTGTSDQAAHTTSTDCQSVTSGVLSFHADGSSVCVDPPGCTTISLASESITGLSGTLFAALGNLEYTSDGLESFAGSGPPRGISGCSLSGTVYYFSGNFAVNAFQPVTTAAGSSVSISTKTTFFNPQTNTEVDVVVDIDFSEVTSGGDTTVKAISNSDAKYAGNFAAGVNGYVAAFLDVTTTASFTGPVTICTTYPDSSPEDGIIDGTTFQENALSFLHEEGGVFVDRTVSRDPVGNKICAQVDSFSKVLNAANLDAVCGPGDDGMECNDGDACTTGDTCSNEVCSGTLNCNDGDPCTDDSCTSPTAGCAHSPGSGASCDDGNLCTQNDTCANGACAGAEVPKTGCRTSEKSLLQIKDKGGERRSVQWKWIKGQATSQAEFGDPTTTADYSLCIYDADGLVMQADIPPAGTCRDKPCWKPLRDKGYNFKDRDGINDGVTKVLLKGSTEDKSKAQVKGKGLNLADPPLPLATGTVAAQVIHGESGLCFGSEYTRSDVLRNDLEQFKAKDQAQ